MGALEGRTRTDQAGKEGKSSGWGGCGLEADVRCEPLGGGGCGHGFTEQEGMG